MRTLTVLLLFLAAGIYGFRVYIGNRTVQVFLNVDSHEAPRLNPVFFEKHIREPYSPYLENQLLTLIIYIVPEHACPSLMDEAQYWVNPMEDQSSDTYNVLVLTPEETSAESLAFITQTCGLDEGSMTAFSMAGPEVLLARSGVFKILYSQEEGVVFCERGNSDVPSFQKLERNIRQTIDRHLDPGRYNPKMAL